MANNIAIPLILSLGVGATMYGLSLQKKEPHTASAIFSIMGATAATFSIVSAITNRSPSGTANGIATMASSLRI